MINLTSTYNYLPIPSIIIHKLPIKECATCAKDHSDDVLKLESSHLEMYKNCDVTQPLFSGAKITVLEAIANFLNGLQITQAPVNKYVEYAAQQHLTRRKPFA